MMDARFFDRGNQSINSIKACPNSKSFFLPGLNSVSFKADGRGLSNFKRRDPAKYD